jgi:hypothetical protein
MLTKGPKYSFARFVAKAISVLLGLTVVTYAMSASAAPNEHYTAFGWHTTKFTVKPFDSNVPPAWNAALKSAATTWNKSHPAVHISIDPESQNKVHFVKGFIANDDRLAEYRKICLPTGCWFEIALDVRNLELEHKEIRLFGEYILLHELGHALGLNDFDKEPGSPSSVMSFYANPGSKPKLHKYDLLLVSERIRVMESGAHQLVSTIALGVLRPQVVQGVNFEKSVKKTLTDTLSE